MRRISTFWKALDDFADAAASRWEWQATLGAEFASVEHLLRKAGRARELPCPSPGGAGCPRRVVRHADGSIRAVCGDRPKACADLDLDADDITILRVDRADLAKRIARALGLSPHQPGRGTTGPIIRIGTHDVYAGHGFPVFLALPGPSADADLRPFAEVIDTPGPRLLLTPTVASLPDALIAALDRAGVVRMALADIMIVDDGAFSPVRPATEIFAALRDAVLREVPRGDAGRSATPTGTCPRCNGTCVIHRPYGGDWVLDACPLCARQADMEYRLMVAQRVRGRGGRDEAEARTPARPLKEGGEE